MWPFRRKASDSLATSIHTLQASLIGKDSNKDFLRRLSVAQSQCPEPFEWILMVLHRRMALLEKQPGITTQESLIATSIRQAEIRAEVRLLRSLYNMSAQAAASLDREKALSQEQIEAVETANY